MDTEDVKTRVSTLEGRWKHTDARIEHLDGRVGSLAVDMASIKADVGTIVKGLDTLASRASQPTNWLGVASLIVTMIIVGSQYVDLRLAPVMADVLQNADYLQANRESLAERGEWIGEYTAKVKALENDRGAIYTLLHETDEKVAQLREQAAAATVSRRAMGDYLKEVDEKGSRAWIQKP